jgi:hypothetical protein
MGFFSKTFKKIKKGFKTSFKSIGERIKKTFKSFGKFMGKIGIVGQLAMSFVLPGIGKMLSKTAGAAFSKVTGLLAKGNKVVAGAGKMLEAGANFAKMGHSAFKTVTEGVSSFVTEMGDAALNQIPGAGKMLSLDNKDFKAAWNSVQETFDNNTDKVMENFNNLIGNSKLPATAGQSAAFAKGESATGKGTTPSSVADTEGFDIDSYKTAETPEPIDTYQTDIPDNIGIDEITVMGEKQKLDFDIDLDPKSLLTQTLKYNKASKFQEGTKKIIDDTVEDIKNLPKKIPEYLGEKVEKNILGKIDEEIDYALGLTEEVETLGAYNQAARYQEVGVGQYESAAINDRAYQMAVDPVGYGMQNPFGYPAQDFYKQQMLQFTRPQPIG